MKLAATGAAIALAFSIPAAAKAPIQPPEPASHPDWKDVSTQGLTIVTNALYDPSSAQVTWTSGFQWAYLKPIIGKRSFGWIACGTINAKNRLGGYVGAQGFLLFVNELGVVTADMTANWISICDTGPAAPLTPDLATPQSVASPQVATLGVAEELLKLAELRDKGVITPAEFEAQKAKLLAR